MFRSIPKNHLSANFTRDQIKTHLVKPKDNNFVVLNYWSPGYSLVETRKTPNGSEYPWPVFRKCSTFEAALAYVTQDEEFNKNARPGHISLQTATQYLSVGPQDPIDTIRFTTKHKIYFQNVFEAECYAFNRVPEQIIDLHSLNEVEVNKMIQEVIKSKKFYSMLSKRLHLTDAESFATAAFFCLQAGGLVELLGRNDQITSNLGALTLSRLVEYVAKAQMEEQDRYPEAREISKKLTEIGESTLSKIKETIIKAEERLEAEVIKVAETISGPKQQ
jgi:hypothetical protein